MRTIKQIFKTAKKSVLIAIGIFAFNCAYAQGYYHGVGGQFEQGTFKLEAENFSETANPGVPGVFYKATYAITEKFAVSAYPFIGFSGSTNSRTGASSDSSIGISLPVVAEMYFGDMDDACFFAGAGFAYSKLGSNSYGSGKAFGPQFSLGGQFELRERLIGLRVAYTLGLNKTEAVEGLDYTKDSSTVLSLGAYYVLGR